MKEVIKEGMWRVSEGESLGSHPPFCLRQMDGVAICWDRKSRQSDRFWKNSGEFNGVGIQDVAGGMIDGVGGQAGG